MKPSQIVRNNRATTGENPEKAAEALFYTPPKSKGVPPMASKLTELQKQIEALQKERDELLSQERFEAVENINAMIRTYGIKPRDLDFGEINRPPSFGGSKSKVATKYKLGVQAWSGRGRKPKWVEDHVAKGGKLDELLVK